LSSSFSGNFSRFSRKRCRPSQGWFRHHGTSCGCAFIVRLRESSCGILPRRLQPEQNYAESRQKGGQGRKGRQVHFPQPSKGTSPLFPPFPSARCRYGAAGNDRLKGGSGNNVLLGGDGDDLLVAGSSRDILIGGRGADRLVGNAEDDILIAGYTLFDADEAALTVILGVWTDSTQSYQQRVAALTMTGVGADQAVRLNASTVSDDGAEDVLTGTSGQDWFLANISGGGVLDKLTDLSAAEFATDLAFINGL
jgi:Ca2+-binding RTX toxin-like protein